MPPFHTAPRFSSALSACGALLVALLASSPCAAADAPASVEFGGGPVWRVAAGPDLFLAESEASVSRQLRRAGYSEQMGGGFSVQFDRLFARMLNAGVVAAARFSGGYRERDGLEYEWDQLAVGAVLSPTFRVWRPATKSGFELGARFTAGVTVTGWTMHGETLWFAAPRVSLGGQAYYLVENFTIGGTVGAARTFVEGVGPAGLSVSRLEVTWQPRIGVRW